MTQETKPSSTPEPPVAAQGITVELSHATVQAFEHALEVVGRHPTFQQFGEGKNVRVRVTYQLSELESLHELKEATWELRKKRAWLHGAEIDWHEMAQLTHCLREFVQKPRRDHCFFDSNFWSGFGCRYALANLSDRINNEWLGFGRLDGEGGWIFDKARIEQHVRKNVYRGFQHCPAFDADYLALFLELFPERVDPIEDNRWVLLRDRQGTVIGCGPASVDMAKKIIYDLQEKIRERRPGEPLQENGKRKLADAIFRAQPSTPGKKKGLLARVFG